MIHSTLDCSQCDLSYLLVKGFTSPGYKNNQNRIELRPVNGPTSES